MQGAFQEEDAHRKVAKHLKNCKRQVYFSLATHPKPLVIQIKHLLFFSHENNDTPFYPVLDFSMVFTLGTWLGIIYRLFCDVIVS